VGPAHDLGERILLMEEDKWKVGTSRVPTPEETARAYFEKYGEFVPDDSSEIAFRKRKIVVGVVAATVAVVAIALGVLLLGSKSANGPSATSISSTSLTAADTAAVKGGCPAHPTTSVNGGLSATPTQVLHPNTFYNARVVTTAGRFSILLYTGSTAAVANDFVYLAQQGAFHCVAFNQLLADGSLLAGEADQPAVSGSVTPNVQVPAGSVVSPAGSHTDTGARGWFVVPSGKGVIEPDTDAVFGRVVSGMKVIDRIDADGALNGAHPRVLDRILAVTIASLQG
jgi:cyclophilin family peptidyl-prolyl cis-trans isomerase